VFKCSRALWAALLGMAGAFAQVSPSAAQTGLQFDGTNDYVTFGQATSALGTPTFTLEVWFLRTGNGITTSSGAGGLTSAVPLLAKGRGEAEGSNKDCNYFLGIQSNRLAADFEDNAGGGNHPVLGTTTIQNNVWYHAAATYDGSSFVLYLNGVQEGSVATSTTPRFDSIQHASLGSALNSTGDAAGFFAGSLDEARIWSISRTQAQIRSDALLEVTSGIGLLGRWGLNDGSGPTASNSVAGSPAGTLTNGPFWAAGSPFAYAYGLKLSGLSSNRGYVSFGDPAAAHLSTFTLETWFRRDGAGLTASTGGATAVPLIAKAVGEADGSTADGNYFLGIDGSTAKLVADFEEGAGGTTPGLNHPVSGTTTIVNGTWYHAAATYDGTSWRLYLNGNLEATLAVGQPVQSNSIQRLGLGAALNSTGTVSGGLNGVLDEARIWSGARTQAQIQATMNTPIASPQAALVARWGLDEGAGTVVRDTSGSAIHGTLNPAPVTTAWAWVAGAPFNAVSQPPPAAPSGLAATAISISRIDLSWTDNATTETSYEVERSTSGVGGPYALLVSLPAGATGYSNTGLSQSTEYCYRVRAVNAGGPSSDDGPACATTPALNPPAAPTALAATATSFSQVHLSWTDNASNETGYEVERSTTGVGGTYSLIATLGANAVAYNDPNRTPVSEYCYRVRATNSAGPSGYADPACATTPGSALDFGGTPANAYVTFGDPDALDLAQFTVECWFRRDGAGSPASTGSGGIADAIPLVTHGAAEADGDTRDMNFFLGIRNTGGVLCADFEEGPGGSGPVGQNHPIVGVTAVGTGWHHAAATYDGTTWRLYLDGNLDASLAVGQPVRSNTIQHAALGRSLTSTGGGSGFFSGALDEVRIWSVARTQVEIQSNANAPITAPIASLVARWGLDEGSGTAVNGSAGTAVQGTITGANYTWTTAAPFNLTYTAPNAPSGLSASASVSSQINLSWTDNSNNELGFEIERSTAGIGGPFSPLATVSTNTIAYADDGLDATTEYCYRVRAVNSSGNSAYDGPVCATTPVFVNRALSFSGSSAQPTYGSFGTSAALRLSAFTIELWVRRDGAGAGTTTGNGGIANAVPLVAKGRAEQENASTNINYFVGLRSGTGVLCADFEEGPGGTSPGKNHPLEGATPLTLGVWYHVAATYDGNIWKLYLNGNLDASLPVEQPVASTNTGAVSLGSALNSGAVPAGFFNGAMDEVRIWNGARDQATIQAWENTQISAPTPGLVARWSLDEGSGTTIGATAGTSAVGTIVGPNYAWLGSGAPFDLTVNLPPGEPVVVAPADGATGTSTSPTLQVSATDPESNPLTVTYYGRLQGPSPGPDFTLIGLPDTQYYTGELHGGTAAIFDAQTNWITANRVARNIVYVGQLGDCVENGDNDGNDIEWQRANTSLGVLETPVPPELPEGIPFGVSVGNHDQSPNGDPAGTTALYNQYFGVGRFTGRTYYGGHFASNNDNWYELFSVSGMDFIVVSMEYDQNPSAAVLSWADNLLATYSTRRAIVLSHFICNTGNPAGFGPQGLAIYNALKNHPNFNLMLCGHVLGEGRRQDTYNGNTVHTMLSDYQGRTNGGDGFLRILEFSPRNSEIRVRTYSPWLDQFENDDDSQFTIPYDMKSATPFHVIGTVSGVPSGSASSVVWSGLAAGTAYEWYATVSDGNATNAGQVSVFRTAGVPTYTLGGISDPSNGGSVTRSPDQETYLQGTSAQLTAVPNPGYQFVEWSGDLTGTANPQSLIMNGDKAATAHFAPDVHTITANAGTNGTINPSGAVPVSDGADQTFTFTPAANYHVSAVTVDGSPVAVAASYTFTNVTSNHLILVQFAIDAGIATGLTFNGTDQYVTFGSAQSLGAAQFTIELWFKRTGAGVAVSTGGGGVTAVPLLTKGRAESDGDTRDMNYFLGIDQTGHLVSDYEEGTGQLSPGLNHPVVGATVINDDVWYHGAAVFDGAALTLWLNGQLDGTTSGLSGRDPQSASIQHAGLGSALNSSGVAAGFFAGMLDEARIWSVARTPCQIVAGIDAELTSGTGLAGRWGLDEGAGAVAGNSVSGSPNGLILNGPSWVLGAPFDASPPVPAAPASPSDLVASAADAYQVQLGWVDHAVSEDDFQIERSTSGAGGPFTLLATVGANVTSYTDSPLTPQTEYCYRVRAVNCTGASAFTDVACASTGAEICNALDFDPSGAGTPAYVTFGNPPALRLPAFTVELWIRRDGAGIATASGSEGIDAIPLITKGRSEDDLPIHGVNYFFGIRESDGVLCADFEEGSSGPSPGSSHPVAGTTAIATGTWHHTAATYDGTTWNLYLDGNLETTLSVGLPVEDTGAMAVALASALNSSGIPAGYFDGALDEVRIWNYARSQSQVQETMGQHLSAPTTGLVGRWALNEGAGTSVFGTAGTGINGTIVGSAGTNWTRTGCSQVVAVGDAPVTELALRSVMPNPVGDQARFQFTLPEAAHVTLEIMDVLGRRVAKVTDGDFGAGRHDLTWDRRRKGGFAPGGVYFARFKALGRVLIRRFVIVP
jgi:concanavalin A-like lectin/glucanase superfamily protein/List-Bact-rpt repeat protein/fibronectin type III domain protein